MGGKKGRKELRVGPLLPHFTRQVSARHMCITLPRGRRRDAHREERLDANAATRNIRSNYKFKKRRGEEQSVLVLFGFLCLRA